MQQESLEFWRIYIIFNELRVFNAMPSPEINYHFVALNTVDILGALHTRRVVCVYLMQQNAKNKEN